MRKVDKILKYLSKHDIEIVSYGLSPNPDGFCYECPDNTPRHVKRSLDLKLDALTIEEEQHLKDLIF